MIEILVTLGGGGGGGEWNCFGGLEQFNEVPIFT